MFAFQIRRATLHKFLIALLLSGWTALAAADRPAAPREGENHKKSRSDKPSKPASAQAAAKRAAPPPLSDAVALQEKPNSKTPVDNRPRIEITIKIAYGDPALSPTVTIPETGSWGEVFNAVQALPFDPQSYWLYYNGHRIDRTDNWDTAYHLTATSPVWLVNKTLPPQKPLDPLHAQQGEQRPAPKGEQRRHFSRDKGERTLPHNHSHQHSRKGGLPLPASWPTGKGLASCLAGVLALAIGVGCWLLCRGKGRPASQHGRHHTAPRQPPLGHKPANRRRSSA